MAMPSTSQGPEGISTSAVRHACNACRARKVKCDRQSPCSTCKSSGIACHTSLRKPEKRQRILVSKKFEHEIVDIKQQLRILTSTLPPQKTQTQLNARQLASISGATDGLRSSTDSTSQPVRRNIYKGTLSFGEDSTHWARSLQKEPSASPASAVLQDAISAASTEELILHQILDAGSVDHEHSASELPLPSADKVLSVLNAARAGPCQFNADFPFTELEEVSSLCQKAYFPADRFHLADYLSMHACIYHVCSFSKCDPANSTGLSPSLLHNLKSTCMTHIALGTQKLQLDLTPTANTIQALLLTVSVWMENDDYGTAWTLLSNACRLCLDAGFHRLPDDHISHSVRKSRLLFWTAYKLDRGLSLSFGRAPNIQDYDISTGKPKVLEDFKDAVTGGKFVAWVRYSEIQGQIYQELYSAQGHRRPPTERAERAEALAQKLLGIMSEYWRWGDYDATVPLASRLMAKMACHAMLTLAYRAIPPSQPRHALEVSDRCVSSARDALTVQLRAWTEIGMNNADAWDEVLQWTILFHPFTPFIIVTNNVIVNHGSDDLQLLQQVLETLTGYQQRPNRNSLARLHSICTRLLRIATLSMSEYQQQRQERSATNTQRLLQLHARNSDVGHANSQNQLANADRMGDIDARDFDFDFGNVLDMPLLDADWDNVLQGWDSWISERNDAGGHDRLG